MRLKARVALGLALLVILVSSIAADAAKPPADVKVDHWHYCVQGQDTSWELQFRAQGVTIDGLSRGQLELVVYDASSIDRDVVSPTEMFVFGKKEPFEVVWKATLTPSATGSLGTYEATLHAYAHGKAPADLVLPAPSAGIHEFFARPVDCQDFPSVP